MSEHCTFVLTGKTLCEIPLPLCAWLQKRKKLWVIHLSVPFKAFSAFQQRQMAFVSSVSLVMFYLVWNIKITNFLFTNTAPKSLHLVFSLRQKRSFSSVKSSLTFTLLFCVYLEPKDLSFMDFSLPTFITEICSFLSPLNSKEGVAQGREYLLSDIYFSCSCPSLPRLCRDDEAKGLLESAF